jgi:predicted DNA-binding protein (UPF0251 family)
LDLNLLLKKVEESETFLEKINLLKDALLVTNNFHESKVIKNEIDKFRVYSVKLLEDVKKSDDDAFNELVNIKDIRNFTYHYAYHIEKYHRYKYKLDYIVDEIKMNIFYHIKRNYRIYDEPHELSLLINSMRGWIKHKVSEGLKSTYKPKDDDYISEIYVEDTSYDETEFHVREIVKEFLDEEELKVFELRFFSNMNYDDIAAIVGKSRATCQRIYVNKIKRKLKKCLGEMKKWE